MEALCREEVEEIAKLARLKLSPEEVDQFQEELTTILTYMDSLAEVNTDGVEPMTHALAMDLRLRNDETEPSLDAEVAVASAPDQKNQYFRVPNIIKSAAR